MGGLMAYLYGAGTANEHTEQHAIASNDGFENAYRGQLTISEARELGRVVSRTSRKVRQRELAAALAGERGGATGEDRTRQNVFHAALSLHPDDPKLSDEQWAQVAREYVAGMFNDGVKADCDWVAVRHGLSTEGNDHIHVAVNLIRGDGTWASVFNDFKRSRDLAREIERRHPEFLTSMRVAESERSSGTYTRVEREKNAGVSRSMLPSQQLARIVRSSATKASNEAEFLMHLNDQGVAFAPRWGKGATDTVVGYSVKLRSDTDGVWRGGGKLARDLTLTKLRERWQQSPQDEQRAVDVWRRVLTPPTRPAVVPAQVNAALKEATRFTIEWTKELNAIDPNDRQAWQREAGRLSGVFADLGQRTPGQIGIDMRWLARRYERMAQDQSRPVMQGHGNAERAARHTDVVLSGIAMANAGSWSGFMAATMNAARAAERAEQARQRNDQAREYERHAYARSAEVDARAQRVRDNMQRLEAVRPQIVEAIKSGDTERLARLTENPKPQRGYERE